jgi:hypothetical protein
MTPQTHHKLPQTDHALLHVLSHIVPLPDRPDWLRTWYAELWHLRHNPRRQHVSLTLGLTRDALWLRTESWRRAYIGTITLCLATLASLCLFATLIMVALSASWNDAMLFLGVRLPHFIAGSPLLVLVVYIVFTSTNTRHTVRDSKNKLRNWLKRQAFLASKTTLLLLLSFLLSADLLHTVHASFPITADLLQILAFVLLALLGLRWSFLDQQTRCKQCLRSLTTPARVGRPSHNLLEWNGTELLCQDGHGALSIPEHQTSWCQSSQWVYQSPTCDEPINA